MALDRSAQYSYLIEIDNTEVRMATATLSTKFQISIPKEVRDQQHWMAGQEFVFIPKGKGVLLMPVPGLNNLRGLAEGANPENYRDRNDRF
jgi:AbrB family looped-hinge helix DNA binding protein